MTNLPGLGAEELASRAARRAARLREDQAMGAAADDVVEEQLRRAVRRQRSYSQGAEGERLVAQVLGHLERYGWVALHDVHWPGRPKANIDHIAVGPGGVVVIDAKNWTGDVRVTNGTLRQNGYSRTRETTSARDAANAVSARLAPEHRSSTHAVLCLVAQDVAPVVVDGTTVVGRSALAAHLVGLPPRLTAYDVADVARALAADLAGDRSPVVLSTKDLEGPPRSARRGGRSPRGQGSGEKKRSTARPARSHGRRVRVALVKLAFLGVVVLAAPNLVTLFVDVVTAVVTPAVVPTDPAPQPEVPPAGDPTP
ncbi:nuclease-related domain-containing protein [Sanguibacter suaedae]|uniref:NERD domain-containing protein n=1 Tax=Sanguibacter suaedae TaxID=2795737 RepID=A0A934I988_9MICO|nr:nuclease-related domain-containing protein [Sanguibacter suaedae]MBI9113721.1 NERD domain-containing protein [Sanguibacter suaedae]